MLEGNTTISHQNYSVLYTIESAGGKGGGGGGAGERSKEAIKSANLPNDFVYDCRLKQKSKQFYMYANTTKSKWSNELTSE